MLFGASFARCLVGFFLLVTLPYIHIGIMYAKIWVPDKKPVSYNNCTCSCWDTVFKGSYENQKKVGYKHMYFNATKQTFSMWTITMAAVLAFYELVKHLLRLYVEGNLRYSMLFLLILSIYPQYFSWWVYLNYFNDDFYKQFVHQMFFTVTELVSFMIIVRMCSYENDITPNHLIGVLSINLVHIVVGGLDQFFEHLVLMDGKQFKRIRSLALVIPDVLCIVISIIEYKRSRSRLISRKESVHVLCLTFLLFLLIKLVLI
ncbi:uncharacterized protein LOC127728413 [Mytilus californianus]|uniref:uncharacterized protein LOC127728413 n=1 Tax=Mytilus californianus TaxID=6549 RepID=UPI002247EC5B|nr:uncharacterized protein LOC127728413 [Mytilus californianus]XP_052091739.1 uncharacterized protein LOC127728413 [Mytilus californianus]